MTEGSGDRPKKLSEMKIGDENALDVIMAALDPHASQENRDEARRRIQQPVRDNLKKSGASDQDVEIAMKDLERQGGKMARNLVRGKNLSDGLDDESGN